MLLPGLLLFVLFLALSAFFSASETAFVASNPYTLEYLEKKLGLAPGGKTADGQFSLETVECQGHCDEAPCMLVNSEYHGNLNPEKIDKILGDLS